MLAAVAIHPNDAPELDAAGELDDALAVIDGLAARHLEADAADGVHVAARAGVGDVEVVDVEQRVGGRAGGAGHDGVPSVSRARASRLPASTVRAMTTPGRVVSHHWPAR